MHRRAPSASGRRAFTLVELLVVIGIIALLMSILLPTLGRVREQANRVKCGSNLRQIGLAVVAYVQNENGYYPMPATSGARGDDIVAYQSGRSLDESAIAKYQGVPFVKEIWICPADDVEVRKNGGANAYRLSYTMNHRFRDNSSGTPKQVKASRVVSPAEKIVMYEEDENTIDDCHASLDNNASIDLVSIRHDRQRILPDNESTGMSVNGDRSGNVMFGDGHVEYLRRNEAHTPKYYDIFKKF